MGDFLNMACSTNGGESKSILGDCSFVFHQIRVPSTFTMENDEAL